MDISVMRILAVVIVICITNGASNSIERAYYETLLRRQVTKTECNSYAILTNRLREAAARSMQDTIRKIFKDVKVTREGLLEGAEDICNGMARETERIQDERVRGCPNAAELLKMMEVFAGICTDTGGFTDFYNDLMADYEYVDTSCFPNVNPILAECPREDVGLDKDAIGGLKSYKRIMIERMTCINKAFDANDLGCGDVPSLKRMAAMFELLTSGGPGAIFTMDDFGL